jgi:hypothetical protein
MWRPTTKWLTVIATAGVIGVGTTCGLAGSAGASSKAARTVRSAHLAATTAVTTTSFSFSASVSGPASTATVTGTGEANLVTHAASLSVDVPAGVAKLIPGGSAAPEVIDAVLSGGTVYVQVPSLASLVGEPWIAVTLPTKVLAHAAILTKLAAALGDVSAIDNFAQAHHATVTSLGNATVDGVDATGTKFVATLSHKGGGRTVTASVWADSSDQLVQANVSIPAGTAKGSLGVTATANFTGDNAPVTITVPPSSQVKVIPYSTVAGLLGKSGRHTHRA